MKPVFLTADGQAIKRSSRIFDVCTFEVPVTVVPYIMEHEKEFGRQSSKKAVAPEYIMRDDDQRDYRAESYAKEAFFLLQYGTTQPIFVWSEDEHLALPSLPNGNRSFHHKDVLCRTCKVLAFLPTGMGARIRKMAEIVAQTMRYHSADFFLWDLSGLLLRATDAQFLWVCDEYGTCIEYYEPSALAMDAWIAHADRKDDHLYNSLLNAKNNSGMASFMDCLCHKGAKYFLFRGRELVETTRENLVSINQQLRDEARLQLQELEARARKYNYHGA